MEQIIPAYDTKIIVGNFNSKIGREDIFKSAIGKCSVHETPNENGIRVIDFATNNNMIIKSTYFPHKNIRKKTWQSPDGRTNYQINHIL